MLKTILEELDYETWKFQSDDIESNVDKLDNELSDILKGNKGSSGLVSDEFQKNPKYKKAKSAYDNAFKHMQQFNKKTPKKFMQKRSKERRAEMMNRGK